MFDMISRVRGQKGFSVAEVIVAVALFVSCITAVSVMLISGGTNVTRGAKESAAANLAEKKLEEVKALPFYRPYEGSNGDIDDYYWAYNGINPRPNSEQRANPVVEDYGSIPGYSPYRRTTSVTYQYISGGVLVDAVMDPNWVPKEAAGVQFDRPTGGPAGGPYGVIHAMNIEVKVYYRTTTGVRTYTAQGLAGDLMVTGGTNNPPLIINSIDPTTAYYGETNLEMTIFVSTPPGTMDASSSLDVYLWYPGFPEVHAKSAPTPPMSNAAGTEITAYFQLDSSTMTRIGYYNLAVYWEDEGWLANFRDNVFEVLVEPPNITSLGTHVWGHRGQNARPLTIYGTGLWNPATVSLKGPYPATTYTIPGTVTGALGTSMTATFNLTGTGVTRPADSKWVVEVTTLGGTVSSDSDAERFWVNPPPTISAVTATSSPTYYDWAYRAQTARDIRVEGTYLYGMNDASADAYTRLVLEPWITGSATFVSGPTGNGCVSSTPMVMRYNPSSAGADASTNNTHWKVRVVNYGGSVDSTAAWSTRVWMNPPPTLTNIAGWPGSPYTGTRNGNQYTGLTVNGSYLQSGAMYAVVRNNPPVAATTYGLLSGGSLNAAGTSQSNMTMNVNVNPMTSSFRIWGAGWGGGAQSDNTLIAGAYYLYLTNGDGQSLILASSTYTINHAQYTINSTSSPAGWGSVTGGGTFWQDQAYALTPNPVSSAGNWVGYLRVWQEPSGTDQWGYPWQITGNATGNRSLNCRFAKWFYHGDDASPNYATWQQTVNDSPYDNIQTARAEGGYRILWVQSKASLSFLSGNNGEVGARTNAQVSFTGASTLYWYSTQTDGNGNGASNRSYICISVGANDRWNVGSIWGTDDNYNYDWRAWGIGGHATGYIHINSQTDYSILGGNETETRTRYVFME